MEALLLQALLVARFEKVEFCSEHANLDRGAAFAANNEPLVAVAGVDRPIC